jgi:glyoxylate utilization-related uncharacterized protein
VKEGEVQISINGEKRRCGPGYLVFFASHDAHSIENASDKPATYFVINICAPAARNVADRPAAEQKAPGKLPSTVLDCEHVPATPSATGSSATICDSPTLTFINLTSQITTLGAGQSTRVDTAAAENALFFVKSGLVEVGLNEVSYRTRAGSFFYCTPNEKLTFKNIGPTPAVFQLIRFTPAPTKGD